MGSLDEGAKQAVENCLKVRQGERVVVITDEATRPVAEALRGHLLRFTDDIHWTQMEEFGERPVSFPDPLAKLMSGADVSIYAAQGVRGELQGFRMPMLKVIEASDKLRHGHMIGISERIMKEGMCGDYQEIQRLSRKVYDKVKDAKAIEVRTEAGTALKASFSPELRWVICDGMIKPGEFSNLPDGEVFTCPQEVEGHVVVDGCLGDFFAAKYGDLAASPVSLDIRKGRAVEESVSCADEELKKDVLGYLFESDENSDRVGEFAIGTNTGLKGLIGNLLQDEKFPGIHIAFGDSYGNKTGAGWSSKTHVDGVLRRTTIIVDGETIMDAGRFTI